MKVPSENVGQCSVLKGLRVIETCLKILTNSTNKITEKKIPLQSEYILYDLNYLHLLLRIAL